MWGWAGIEWGRRRRRAARNRALLRELGTVVWLQASPEVALGRIEGASARPALTELEPIEEARVIALALVMFALAVRVLDPIPVQKIVLGLFHGRARFRGTPGAHRKRMAGVRGQTDSH